MFMRERFDSYKVIAYALSFIYIAFGLLKVIGRSPIKSLVVAAMPFMQNDVLFGIFGAIEVFLGLGLLFRRTRGYAALGIILHLLGTFSTLLLASTKIFTPSTLVTFEGEFVFKNILLIAVAYFIFRQEREGLKLPRIKFTMM